MFIFINLENSFDLLNYQFNKNYMEQVVLNLQKPYAGRMQTLMKVLGNDLMIDNFLDYHINRLKREIARMQYAMNKFETKYQLSSDEFYTRLENGEFGDDKDFVQWSGIYELQLDSKQKLAQLV